MNRYRYRQLFLFLVVLILPTLAIAIQGRRIAAQERELAVKRSEEFRKSAAAEVGKDIFSRLERIKLQEIARAPAGAVPHSAAYSDPAVAFVGWEENDRLVWPWDVESRKSSSHTAEEAESVRKIEEGERAEIADKNYAQAAGLYRAAVNAAHSEGQKASARLPLARVLSRSGASTEAQTLYKQLLNLPSTVTDEYGLSFASYAAALLVESHAAEAEVLERVNRDLNSLAPLTPSQAYRMRSVLEELQKSSVVAIRAGAGSAMEQLSARVKDLEQALDVQKDFGKLRVTTESWQPYTGASGNALWWIGKASTGADSRPLILAIRFEDIRKSIEAGWLSRNTGSPIRITESGDSGEPLGPGFPGLRVLFSPANEADAVGPHGQRSFYALSLFFVVTLTFVGAFFLWRDTRRETRIAELRSQFVSSVSHELKTPLTSIRMFAETLQMNDETGSDNRKMRAEYLDTIVNETERLTRLLNNVLDFSRIERGHKNYHMESALLPDVIDAAVRTMRFPLSEQGFDLKVDLSESIPPLKVDRDALEQAILNLLSNAMKYSGKSREIELRLCRQNGSALIQVSDHGVGIPADQQRRIFEKYYRVPTKENKAISGTGLGLALVTHIAEAHGGSVEVESRPGDGSTFSIRIPVSGNGES